MANATKLVPIMQASGKVVDRAADTLSGGALASGLLAYLTDVNIVLETVTLLLGAVAGVFALFFHYRRWRNERKKLAAEVAEKVVEKVSDDQQET